MNKPVMARIGNSTRTKAAPGTTIVNPGSFRDPRGRVFESNGRIFRTVNECAVADFEFVRDSGLMERLVADGQLLGSEQVEAHPLGREAATARYVLEHPRLPFVSYPYEWCFSELKAAALLHLEIHLRALDAGITLSDASAYNVQFLGSKPVFIDRLSFRPYHEGEYWIGHRQFCEQFLNPLLLRAVLGVPHNAWYRGAQEGIGFAELNRLLPVRRKLSINMLAHVVLQSRFQKSKRNDGDDRLRQAVPKRPLPRAAFQTMLGGLRRWIERLEPADTSKSVWSDYANSNSYDPTEMVTKAAFVRDFIGGETPAHVWDLGCNTGDYAKVAIDAGAGYVVGFDLDQGALDAGFKRAQAADLPFLPLYLDAANPTPSQGWAESERPGIRERVAADGLLALALVHHLAIARNIPLEQIADWLVDMAPAGVVEFVPKGDPMVQRMLALREDIFEDYSEPRFVAALRRRARIRKTQVVSASGRTLIWYAEGRPR